jgi:hypothetical protein
MKKKQIPLFERLVLVSILVATAFLIATTWQQARKICPCETAPKNVSL